MDNYLTIQDTLFLKNFPSKSELRTFFNDRLFSGKVKRINTRNASCVIFTVQNSGNDLAFTPSYCRVQSIDFTKNQIIFTISKSEYKSLMNDVIYWRNNPEKAQEMGFTVI